MHTASVHNSQILKKKIQTYLKFARISSLILRTVRVIGCNTASMSNKGNCCAHCFTISPILGWRSIIPIKQKAQNNVNCIHTLTLSNPIFLPPTYSQALIYFGRERGWWVTCNYPTVLKEKNINRKSTTCTICWLKSVLHEEKRREQENHNVGPGLT
jgi:hypothetical protein